MRQQKKIALFLVSCILLMSFSGCKKTQMLDKTQDSTSANSDNSATENTSMEMTAENGEIPIEGQETPTTDKELVITIETVEINLKDLEAQKYIVPVSVTLEKNPGISYSEWGVWYDERCEMTASSDDLDYNTIYAFSEDKPFLWTAWSGGMQVSDHESPILTLYMQLPEDAAVGDFYTINYESISQADTSHKWSDGENDWVALNAVSWNDGGVRVVVSDD